MCEDESYRVWRTTLDNKSRYKDFVNYDKALCYANRVFKKETTPVYIAKVIQRIG